MINPPSTFGQPEAAAQAPEPEPEPTRKPRTVMIAAVAGVVALGVLGGAAALVLTSGDDDAMLEAAPAPAVVEPTTEPSVTAEVVAPLPVSAVRSRNIFVPLVEEASEGESAAGEDEGAATEENEDSEDGEDRDDTRGSTSGGGGLTQVVVDQASVEALRASEQQVAELQRQITDLTTRLEAEDDDSALQAKLRDLQEQYELLFKEAQDLKDALDAQQVTVEVVEVDDTDEQAFAMTLLVDDVERVLDLDPATEDVLDTTMLGEPSDDITIRYLSYLPAEAPEPAKVSLEIGSTIYTVAVGSELLFYLG
ncbi:hypothetical protein [Aquipuribacter sp. MA13-6]|uniref:hypothetical protein n=1 Tax=unclassified Aquipuribacter TaxID=2635084 RepID=UPI003EEB5D0F